LFALPEIMLLARPHAPAEPGHEVVRTVTSS
jgi:hypothetical protein